MPPPPPENKIAELRNGPTRKKRQRPEEELVQENQNETVKRVRTTRRGAEGQLNARRETVRKQQKEAEVSTPPAAGSRRPSTRKTKSTKPTKTDQPQHGARTDGEQTSLLLPQGFAGKADYISVAEVAEMVKRLNGEIEQVSGFMTHSLSYQRLPGSGSKLGVALNELQEYLGAQLCNELQHRSKKVNMEPDPLITQIALRTGLANTCSRIIMLSDWDHPFWGKDSTISRIVGNMERAEQLVADTWSKQTHTNTTVSLHENQEVYGKYLTEVLLNLITAVGGSPQSDVTQYNAKLEGIVRQAIELQKIVSKDVTSTGLVTYAIPCHEEFDASQMEDVKLDDGYIATAPLGRVACTVEIGLRCRKRVDSGSEVRVPVKPKVVLAATLEVLCFMALEKNINQLDAKVAELSRLLQKHEEKISSMEMGANRRNEDHAREIEARIVEWLQTTELRDIQGTANEQVQALSAISQVQGVERRQAATGLRDISVEGEQTPRPSAFVRKPDSISVAEVAELVRILNAQIEQVSILVADSLSYKETPRSGEEARIALDELDDHVGQWLHNNLWYRSGRQMEADPLITQITIQTGLVNVCCGIISGSLISGYSLDAVGARDTEAPRALAHSQNKRKESVQKYLMELLLKLITATGGSLETLQSKYSEKVEDITKKAIELHRIVSQDVTSVELSTYTIPCDTSFDPSQMEDTEGGGDVTVPVVCTLEMGLRCRKKVVYAKQSGFEGEQQDVTMKAKVVLATTLETEIPE